jgi:hypothetical protein
MPRCGPSECERCDVVALQDTRGGCDADRASHRPGRFAVASEAYSKRLDARTLIGWLQTILIARSALFERIENIRSRRTCVRPVSLVGQSGLAHVEFFSF